MFHFIGWRVLRGLWFHRPLTSILLPAGAPGRGALSIEAAHFQGLLRLSEEGLLEGRVSV